MGQDPNTFSKTWSQYSTLNFTVLQKYRVQFYKQVSINSEKKKMDALERTQVTDQKLFFKLYPVVKEDTRNFNISCA